MFLAVKELPTYLFELQVCLVVGGDMQFSLASDANSGPHPIRRSCEGGGIDRLERLSIGGSKQEKALRNRCFGGRVAATTQCILTSDACPETLVSIQLNFYSYMVVYYTFVFSREIYYTFLCFERVLLYFCWTDHCKDLFK
jgi:hypothetical protein